MNASGMAELYQRAVEVIRRDGEEGPVAVRGRDLMELILVAHLMAKDRHSGHIGVFELCGDPDCRLFSNVYRKTEMTFTQHFKEDKR